MPSVLIESWCDLLTSKVDEIYKEDFDAPDKRVQVLHDRLDEAHRDVRKMANKIQEIEDKIREAKRWRRLLSFPEELARRIINGCD